MYNKPGGQGTGGKGKLQVLVCGTTPGAGKASFYLQARHLVAEEGLGDGPRASSKPESSYGFYTGVACITLAFVEEGGAPISLASWPPSSPGPPGPLQEEEFEQLTQVIRCPNTPDNSQGKKN